MIFSESETYLLSLGNEVSAMKLGLENIRTLLTALGEPQSKYLKVQVAGTNGKGSVCAFLDAICLEAGVKAGVFTSPHLIAITERVRVNGVDISEDEFARHATQVRETAEKLLADGELDYRPTFFEQVTAVALVAFAEAKVELAILETGLGGRLDATTAANAEIAAITQIDLDHQEYLGNTIEEIAAEKAAIIHAGSSVVVAKQDQEADRVINDRLTLFKIEEHPSELVSTTCGSGWLKFVTEQGDYELRELGLKGRHQIENARVAILLAEILQDHFAISQANIIDGLANARNPGRLESSGKYLFDGAHNIAGAKALWEYLDESVTQPITLVFGAMKEKDIAEIASELFPAVSQLVLTVPENSRALKCDELIQKIPSNILPTKVFTTESVSKALDIAETVTPDDGIILVTGSLYLVGEAKRLRS